MVHTCDPCLKMDKMVYSFQLQLHYYKKKLRITIFLSSNRNSDSHDSGDLVFYFSDLQNLNIRLIMMK